MNTIEQLPVISGHDCKLFVSPIDAAGDAASGRLTRRIRETGAVMRLVENFFGTDVSYGHTDTGMPTISPVTHSISVSHSTRYAALLVGPLCLSVGVDIEQPRPGQLKRVARRFLRPVELDIFKSDEDLLWAWAAKEAVYKAARTPGLSGPEIALEKSYGNCAYVNGERYMLSSLRTVDYLVVTAIRLNLSGTPDLSCGEI